MKKILAIILVVIMVMSLTACKSNDDVEVDSDLLSSSEEKVEFSEFEWPTSEIADLLPVPKSKIGRIEWEASYGFVIYVGETSIKQYNAYVKACTKKGFTVDYRKGDYYYYYADNNNGYNISVTYEGDNTMFIRISKPNEEEETTSSSKPKEETTSSSKKPKKETSSSKSTNSKFREAMDSYETFFDEYIEFMQNYKDSKDIASMLTDYVEYMSKYADMMSKMDEWSDQDLSTADALYYTEVTARIAKKLAKIVY